LFVILQFPLLDARPFVPKARIGPPWPHAQQGDFIRAFGNVERRKRGSIVEWPADAHYCRAKNAVKFPNKFGAQELGQASEAFLGKVAFRRLYVDTEACRLEVGLTLRRRQPAAPTSGVGALSLLRSLLSLPVGIRNGAMHKNAMLSSLGSAVAHQYLRSTLSKTDKASAEDWWISAGNPSILCEYDADELADLPPYSTNVVAFDFQHLDLAHCHVEHQNVRVGVWFLRKGNAVNSDELRRLRLNLVRVHEEKETVRLLLRLVTSGQLAFNLESTDRLQEFLDRVIGALESKSRFGIAQAPLLSAAREVTGAVEAGERELLLQSITQIRRTVRNKIERQTRSQTQAQIVTIIDVETINMTNKTTKVILGDNATISGPFNVVTAETIQNSFNAVAKSNVSDDLKKRLQELTVQVTELAKQMPPEQAESVARDLESLTKEATAKAPRKKWYDLSAEGLIDAAKAVAGMAAPVTTAVKAVLALLG
jgi:hypothetical protein